MRKVPDVTTLLDWAYASRPANGQNVCGDLHLVQPFKGGVLLAAIDGLGHGEEAAAAARKAVGVLTEHTADSIVELLQRCHGALAGTRGAVATLASVRADNDTMTWLGVGNVEGWVIRSGSRSGPPMESVLLRGGLLGYQLPTLQACVTTLAKGDLLVLATDGVGPDFAVQARVTQTPRAIADHILQRFSKGTDDGLVLVARYLGLPA